MIRIGNQTAFSAASVTEPFEYAIASGFDAFEWFPDRKPDGAGWDESNLGESVRRSIRESAIARGVRQSVHARWQANPLDPESHPLLLKDLELARSLGAVLLNIHLFLEKGLDAYIDAITPLIQWADLAGLQLAIENTPEHAPEDFNGLFARLRASATLRAQHVGMCLDLGHANLCAATRNNYLGFVDRLDAQVPIIHLHLHENWGDADTHLPLFTGPARRDDSGIRGFVERLLRRKYSGSVIFEQWPQPSILLDQARDRLRSLFGEVGAKPKPAEVNPEAGSDFAQQLADANRCCRSWREKLDFVFQFLVREDPPLTIEHLVDVAIYLRFLGTGEIPCAEDGRHFRPDHHARLASQIRSRLARMTTPANVCVIRKIYPWLPSAAPVFQRAEPLTRIRDIAHRNDIPSELKREIKTTLQNKLHRCAGPEDLVTSGALLERITAPGAGYSTDFVEQFKVFHGELREFFNARSLEDRLRALAPAAGEKGSTLIQRFLAERGETSNSGQLAGLEVLTELRRTFLDMANVNSGAEAHELLMADIELEDFAFVVLSRMLNGFDAPGSDVSWDIVLETLILAISNLSMSGAESEECSAIESEVRAWKRTWDPADREQALRLKATVGRCRRLAEDYSSQILALFPGRVGRLGAVLGVPEHAIRVFSDAEIRSHIIFQVSKLASYLLKRLRSQLKTPAWDVLVAGKATGRLVSAGSLGEIERGLVDPTVALVAAAEGDEEIPGNVIGIILAQEVPHLSHLGVRARQAGVVFAICGEPSKLSELQKRVGQIISLAATPEDLKWEDVTRHPADRHKKPSRPIPIPKALLDVERPWISLDGAGPLNAGGKAHGANLLNELAELAGAGFKTPSGLVIPFGVMEAALRARPDLDSEFKRVIAGITGSARDDLSAAAERLGNLIQLLSIPDEITGEIAGRFGPGIRVMVRSSSNCEDLESMAGAGLYESVANVPPEGVESAVRRVWASLWSRRAILSRNEVGIPHDHVHMAVLVQQMLTPDYSFVIHTVNPVTQNSREVYAELVVGLGETLVSAAVPGAPYRMVCEKETGAVSMLAFASFKSGKWPDPNGGIRQESVDYSHVPLSTDAGVRARLGKRLARIGQFVENALQKPQDIEGCVVGYDIFLVQSRPQQGLHSVGNG